MTGCWHVLIRALCDHLHSYAASRACLSSERSVFYLPIVKIRKRLQVAKLRVPSLFTEAITVTCSPSWHLHLGVRSSAPGGRVGVQEWVIKTGNSGQSEPQLHTAQEMRRQSKPL